MGTSWLLWTSLRSDSHSLNVLQIILRSAVILAWYFPLRLGPIFRAGLARPYSN